MEIELSDTDRKDIAFLEKLSDDGIMGWPIDFETNHNSPVETANIIDLWMGSKRWRETGHQFIQFGQDGCGSLFCLWFYPGLVGEFPVIFLGSEGDSVVVANSPGDFVRQITSGKMFFEGNWLSPDSDEIAALDWERLKNAAREYTGSFCDNPSALTSSAQAKHPDISAWIESNLG